jgi:glycoside/pentoside/hexuronide:cation symporter, GPH family
LTSGIHERTSVGAYRSVLGKLGGLAAGWTFWLTQRPVFADETGQVDTLLGARWVYAGFGLLIILFGVTCAMSTPERFYAVAARQKAVGLLHSFQLTFGNRNFRRMALITLSFATGAFLVSGLTFFLKLNYLFGGDANALARLVGIEGTVTFVCGMMGIPLFQHLSHRLGKSRALLCALGCVFSGALLTWFLLTPEMPYLYLGTTILTTPALTSIWVIVPSMNADIIDEDELANGCRRDGAFASVYSWVVKLSMSCGFALSGPIVQSLGFLAVRGPDQADGVIFNMRLAVVVIPALTLVPALWLLARYPLTIEKVREIQTQLLARRGDITP